MATWCYYFLGYLSVLTTDSTTRDQMAYACLHIREAQRHGGQAWLNYDWPFCQQAVVDPTILWKTINPGLQAETILSQQPSGQATFCTLCRMVNHVRSQCALQFLEPTPVSATSPHTTPISGRRFRRVLCFSWNLGQSSFPGRCKFRHICSSCESPTHRATDCHLLREDLYTGQGHCSRLLALPSVAPSRR